MKELKIQSITSKGEAALKQHWEESKKIKLLHKFTFKKLGYKQELLSENPFIILLSITNPYFQVILKEQDMINKVKEGLKEFGAKIKTDYFIETKG